MSNPAQSFCDDDYKTSSCTCLRSEFDVLDSISGKHWKAGESQICSCFVSTSSYCVLCGHEADCHTVVRVQL